MKKFALVLALLAIAGFVFADTVVVPTLSGSANTTFGVNLNDEVAIGFTNSTEATVAFTLIDAQAGDMMGEDDLYGSISVSGFKVTGDNDSIDVTSASVSAKIVAGSLYVTIGATPSFDVNKADAIDNNDDGDPEEGDVAADLDPDAGLTIGVSGDVSFGLKIASKDDWKKSTDDGTAQKTYFLKNDGTIQVVDDDNPINDADPILSQSIDASTDNGNVLSAKGFIIGADFGMAFGDMGSVAASLGFDLSSNEFDLGLSLPLTLGPASLTIASDIQYTDDVAYDLLVAVGLAAGPASVSLTYYTYMFDDMDIKLSVDLSALADPLTLTIAGTAEDIITEDDPDTADVVEGLGWTADVDLAYDVNGIKPYVNFGYGSDEVFDLGVGAELSAAATGIDNTVIKLDYTSTDLSSDNGIITLGVTISM